MCHQITNVKEVEVVHDAREGTSHRGTDEIIMLNIGWGRLSRTQSNATKSNQRQKEANACNAPQAVA